ncbi:MAG: type II secretion system secretin GspD, partial [Myxococcota bacterium]
MLRRLTPLTLLMLAFSTPAWAQDDEEDNGDAETEQSSRQRPPKISSSTTQKVTLDFVDTPLMDVIKYFAEITGRNFILQEDIKGSVTIISHRPVTVGEAYEAFLTTLNIEGFTISTVGGMNTIIPTKEAPKRPIQVREGSNIPYTDGYVTQLIQLENVSVSDITSVVEKFAGGSAQIVAYAPTNTLIIVDSAVNIRRVYSIINKLDVSAPKARMEIIPLAHATAAEVKQVIEQLYGSAESSTDNSSSNSRSSSRRGSTAAERRRNRRNRDRENSSASSSADSTKVGAEGKYIEKIIDDERTNSLIVLANDEAMQAVKDLIAQLDVDVDPASRAGIHVIYLEHAKAEDVATVLSNLSENNSSNNSRNTNNAARRRLQQARNQSGNNADADSDASSGSAVAALDSGVRITSDENTNSLVIVATNDQLQVLNTVIQKLDIRRKQVFVEAVIMELTSEDSNNTGLGVHIGRPSDDSENAVINVLSAQLGASSLGLSQDLLSGTAAGVFGPSIDVPVTGTDGTATSLSIPAFGVVLQALQSNTATNILSTPNILTTDNEEAKIIVGRNVPFPVSNAFNNVGQPVISFQREDVAITLQVTPQINESNFVTLEVFQEVQEVEGDISALDANSGGPITSKRSAETTVVVRDNQTIVLGGLMGSTDSEVETKIPVLGDIPLIGRLFRGSQVTTRKTNLLIFLTPHVIDEPADLEEVYRVKVAQRQEFVRRFYGKSREEQEQELAKLLQYSMNRVDQPSVYRGPDESRSGGTFIEQDVSGSSTPMNDATPPPPPTPPHPTQRKKKKQGKTNPNPTKKNIKNPPPNPPRKK